MTVTIGLVVATITLILGEITKVTSIPNKYIPIQNVIVAVLASIICIVFKVENLGVLETIITCVFASMSAGGLADLAKIIKK